MARATNYPEIGLLGGYHCTEKAVYDCIPALMQLFEELGYFVDNRVDCTNKRQMFTFTTKQDGLGAYCAVKNDDQVQIDSVTRASRIKKDDNWIDLKHPSSIEMIRRRAKKAVSHGWL